MTPAIRFVRREKTAITLRRLYPMCLVVVCGAAHAQAVTDAELQKRANAILTLMGFAVTPDVTTGSLSLTDTTAGSPYFRQTSLSGGGTLRGRRLYLEGTLAYGRYNPVFLYRDSYPFPGAQVKFRQAALFPFIPSITYQFKFFEDLQKSC